MPVASLDPRGDGDDCVGEREVERRASDRDRGSRPLRRDERPEHRRRVDHPVVDRRTRAMARRRRSRRPRPRAPSRPAPRTRRRGGCRGASSRRRTAVRCSMSLTQATRRASWRSSTTSRARGAARHRRAGRRSRARRRPGDGRARRAPVSARRRRRRGAAIVPQVRDALEAVVAGDERLAAPDRAVGAVAGAVERERRGRLADATPCSAISAADVRVVVLHERTCSARACSRPTRVCGTRGAASARPALRSTPVHRAELRVDRSNARERLERCPCRRCAGSSTRGAARPGRTCSSARRRPRAAGGRVVRQRDRERGVTRATGGSGCSAPSTTRTTESSHGTWIGRSCTQPRVGDAAEAGRRRRRRRSRSARRSGCRSSSRAPPADRLVDPGTAANSRWCSGRVGQHHADQGVARRDPSRPARRIGARGATIGRARRTRAAPPRRRRAREAARRPRRRGPSPRTACRPAACAPGVARPRRRRGASHARW